MLSRILSLRQHPAIPDQAFSKVVIVKCVLLAFAASFLAGIQYQLIHVFYGAHVDSHILNCQQTLAGMPGWKMHQSRYIGPHLVEGLHKLTGWDYATAYHVTSFLLLLLFFITILIVSRSLWGNWLAALATAAAAGFLNAFLMQGVWLYTWDLVHLVILTVFVWALFTHKPFRVIAIILLIEIFNHDLVFVLAAWVIIDATIRIQKPIRSRPNIEFKLHLKPVLFAAMIMVGGYFVIEYLRELSFNEATLSAITVDTIESNGHQVRFFGDIPVFLHFNLDLIGMSFMFDSELAIWEELFDTENLIVFNPLILGVPILALWGIVRHGGLAGRISLLILMLWIAIFVSSPIYETRAWVPLVPFLVILIPMLYQQPVNRSQTAV